MQSNLFSINIHEYKCQIYFYKFLFITLFFKKIICYYLNLHNNYVKIDNYFYDNIIL